MNSTLQKTLAYLKRPLLGCLIAGATLPLAFAPYHLWFIAFASLASLFMLIENSTPKQAFYRGLWFGIGAFGTGISWVYIAVRYFGNAAPPLAVLLTLLLVLYMALFPGLTAWLHRKYFHQSVLAFPCLWVLTEWFRGWFLTGFPWLFVGYSQMTLLGGFAPVGGIYLVSFITALIATLLANIRSRILIFGALIICLTGFGYFGQHIPWTAPNHKTLTVSLLQGNIAKELKWNPQKTLQNIDSYVKMTRDNWGADFIVWPEGTFSLSQIYGKSIIDQLSMEAKKHGSTVALGLPFVRDKNYYNSLMLIGKNHGLYSKRHLVPFGEFTPLGFLIKPMMSWLQIPMSDYSEGADHQALLKINGILIAPFICYEIVYPSLVHQDLPEAQILLTISEDAWYGNSIAVDQHLQMAQMRSLEAARYSLFAVNTGISAVIDEHGHVLQSVALNKRGVINATIPAIDGTTPWIFTGDWPWLMMMVGGLGVLVVVERRSEH